MRARCTWCGEVRFPIEDLVCGVPSRSAEALCEFDCPGCGATIYHRTSAQRAESLMRDGARPAPRTFPLELLEPHAGAPITWDDVLDFSLALGEIDALEASWDTSGLVGSGRAG